MMRVLRFTFGSVFATLLMVQYALATIVLTGPFFYNFDQVDTEIAEQQERVSGIIAETLTVMDGHVVYLCGISDIGSATPSRLDQVRATLLDTGVDPTRIIENVECPVREATDAEQRGIRKAIFAVVTRRENFPGGLAYQHKD